MNMTSSILEKGYCFISSIWKVPCITFCIVLTRATTKIQIKVSIIISSTASIIYSPSTMVRKQAL